jgi:hypothetical protein
MPSISSKRCYIFHICAHYLHFYYSPQMHTGHFIMFSMITNIYNKKIKGPTLMELFTATGKREVFFVFVCVGLLLLLFFLYVYIIIYN